MRPSKQRAGRLGALHGRDRAERIRDFPFKGEGREDWRTSIEGIGHKDRMQET